MVQAGKALETLEKISPRKEHGETSSNVLPAGFSSSPCSSTSLSELIPVQVGFGNQKTPVMDIRTQTGRSPFSAKEL